MKFFVDTANPVALAHARARIANHAVPLAKTAGVLIYQNPQFIACCWMSRPDAGKNRRPIYSIHFGNN